MSNRKKLKRITDLFSEGETCFLGWDDGAPVCVWVNKNNSLEEEEARNDASSARTEMLYAMADPANPEIQNVNLVISEWTDKELYEAVNNQKYDTNLTAAINDIDADKEWTEKLEYLRRQPELLDDASVPEEDPRRKQWEQYNEEYLTRVDELTKARGEKTLKEVTKMGREAALEEFLKAHKERISLDHYILEAKVTRLYYAIRECEATKSKDDKWDHSKCDHSQRLLETRSELRELPDHVLTNITRTFDNMSVGAKNVGNFLEPQSSSESSAPQNDAAV